MTHRLLGIATAGMSLAATVLLVQAPAAAGPGDPKPKDLRETGCRDITNGTARYDRDRVVDSALFPDEGYPDELQDDSGTATLDLVLAAPSCQGVTYTLTVYGANQQVLAQRSVPGDGVTGTAGNGFVLTERVDGYAADCLLLVATTSVQGIAVDTAPDAEVLEDAGVYDDVCDGASPGLPYK